MWFQNIFPIQLFYTLIILANLSTSYGIPATTSDESCTPLPTRTTATEPMWNDKTLQELLENGKNLMEPDLGKHSKAVFVFGVQGSAKTPLIHILTRDLSSVYATRTPSGYTVILDGNNPAGSPTTYMETLIPKLSVTPNNQIAIWDCPNFQSHRDLDVDVATKQFINYALNTTSEAKYLFAVRWNSVADGANTADFDLLVSRATELISHIPEVSTDSIGLVVTKVPTVLNNGDLITDEQVVETISKFLKHYKKNLHSISEHTTNNTEKQELKHKEDFVKLFLDQEDNLVEKVAFVRTITKCGPPSEIDAVEEIREKITTLVSEKLIYSPANVAPYNTTLDENQTKEVERILIQRISEYLHNALEDYLMKLKSAAQKLVPIPKEWEDEKEKSCLTLLTKLSKLISNLLLDLDSFTATELVDKLKHIYNEVGLEILESDKPTFDQILKTRQQLIILESGMETKPKMWKAPLEKFPKTIDDLYEFIEFCGNIKREMGSYENQQALSGVSKLHENHTLTFLQERNILPISPKIEKMWNEELSYNDKLFVTGVVQDHLPSITTECKPLSENAEEYQLVVTGRYIRMSEFRNISDSLENPCNDTKNVKEVIVAASDTLFWDDFLVEKFEGLKVSLVAKKWIVAGYSGDLMVSREQGQEKLANVSETGWLVTLSHQNSHN